MDGIIGVYKPKGMTSHDVVFKLRKILRMKKIGHAGTLDPNVDGVLPVALGRGTKTIEFLQAAGKTYTGSVTLGFATETEDLDGAVVETKPVLRPVASAQIQAEMTKLTGTITQVPPMYSAVKVNGRRLYQYARAGETVERPKRQAEIYQFEIVGMPEYDALQQTQTFQFRAVVSKGTYIRTLAVDLGRALGYPAVMSQLTREQSGGFTLADTHTLEEFAERMQFADDLGDWLEPIDYALKDLPHFTLSAAQWGEVKDGKGLSASDVPKTAAQLVYVYAGEVKSVVAWNAEKNQYRPYRTFKIH